MFIEEQIARITKMLAENQAQQAELLSLVRNIATTPVTTEEVPISTEEAARFLGISKQTVYQNRNKLNPTKRFGKLYFFPSRLREYRDGGRVYE